MCGWAAAHLPQRLQETQPGVGWRRVCSMLGCRSPDVCGVNSSYQLTGFMPFGVLSLNFAVVEPFISQESQLSLIIMKKA